MSSLPTTPKVNATASAGWLAVLGFGVFVLSLLSLELTRLEAGVALVWLSSGLAVGVLLSWPGRIPILAWLTLALALVGARLMAGDGAARILLMSSLNLAEVALVVSAVRRFGRPLAERQNLLRNAFIGALASVLACAVLALLAAVGLGLIGQRALGFVLTALALFSAHLLGMVTTASVVTMAIGQRGRLLGPRGSRGGFALSWLLLVAVLTGVMAQTTYPLLFLPLLPLAWLAYRHGVGGAVMGVLGVAVMAGGASILRLGPFQLVGPDQPFVHSLLPQVYVLTASLLALPLALLVAERRRLLMRLRRSEARYRLLAEHTRDLVVRLAADGQRRYVSASSFGMLGYRPDELMQPRWELVHPDDAAMLQERLGQLFREGGQARVEFRVRHREGHWVWIEALAERVPCEDGEGWDVVYSGRDVSARMQAEQALQEQARTDVLTGLANRREFDERLGRALARARRYGQPLAVFALDLDHFKQINDTLGHAAGDEALIEFGRRIRASVYETDLVARLGGDEFAVLMEQLADAEACDLAAQRLLARMAEPMPLAGQPRVVGTSIGIAYCADGEIEAEALLGAADAALYGSKRGGRGRFLRVDVGAEPAREGPG